ncbi:MAG: hypothetical protein JXX14_23280 [Deltaproteobacteria bacterium]|nr:hypothetical protein [Deltaproteobacteria bacterium]
MKKSFLKFGAPLLVLLASTMLCGCNMFLEEEPGCEEKMLQFYDKGCVFYNNYQQLSEWEAVDFCMEGIQQTREVGCEKYVYRWLKCSDEITEDYCDGCNYHLDDMYTCIEAANSE